MIFYPGNEQNTFRVLIKSNYKKNKPNIKHICLKVVETY